jgi:hypothetical protein
MMFRSVLLTTVVVVALGRPAGAQDQFAVKTRFELTRSGNFVGLVLSNADPTVLGLAITAGCAAFGLDCSRTAGGVSAVVQAIKQPQNVHGGNVNGIYRLAPGWEICKAMIDWANTRISGGSTFNTTIAKNARDNGLEYNAFVEQDPSRGTGITSDIYLYFVKPDKTAEHQCWADGTHPWLCTGPSCASGPGQRILPEARYYP